MIEWGKVRQCSHQGKIVASHEWLGKTLYHGALAMEVGMEDINVLREKEVQLSGSGTSAISIWQRFAVCQRTSKPYSVI